MGRCDCCLFEYDAANKVLAVHVTGPATDDSFKACYANAARYVEGRDVHSLIVNLTELGQLSVSAKGIRDVSRSPSFLPDPAVRYVIAPQDHIFGMARMFQMVSPKGRDMLHVVRSLRAAHEALGVTPQQFERLPALPELS